LVEKLFYTVREVSNTLGITEYSVREWLKTGKIIIPRNCQSWQNAATRGHHNSAWGGPSTAVYLYYT